MAISFKYIKRDINKWSILLLTIVLFISIPIFTIAYNLFLEPGQSWQHILKHLMPNYLKNSLFLLVGCTVLTFVFGVFSAWIITYYKIPFKKQLDWLLILPLAIPSYITAYAYVGIFDYGGIFEKLVTKVNIMNIYGLIFVLSISLYPYVFLASRAFFQYQSNNIVEASKLLGARDRKTFFKLILPLARPAIIGGLILVLMEVLNDYGAAKYYGINTLTTGIFRAWFALEEPQTAIYIAAILVALIFVLILVEKKQRGKKAYFNSVKNHNEIKQKLPTKPKQVLYFIFVFSPILLGFILPVLQLLYWAYLTFEEVFTFNFITIAFQSFILAVTTSFFTVLVALALIFFARWNKFSWLKSLSKISVLGYAIPGAVIAVGILIPTLSIDKWLINLFKNSFDIKIGFIINGTVIALIYGYVVRFLAVAYNPIEATSLKLGNTFSEVSKLLQKNNITTFKKVEFPLLKATVLGAFILVFVDVMKELPLTLILKPYSIETLAVKAYEYASDELIAEASIPSLFIVLTGVIPVFVLNKLMVKL